MANHSEKRDFLVLGYKAAIVLSFIGILASAIYLFVFLSMSPTPGAVENQLQLLSITAERRMLLLSTAIFVAMSFGFLGFGLFLIQAKGDIDLKGSVKDYKLKIARLSPGLFVILCSTVIIIICATFRIEYEVGPSGERPGTQTARGTAGTPDVSPDRMGISGGSATGKGSDE